MDAWIFFFPLHLPNLEAGSFVKWGEDINYLPKSCPGPVAICKAEENQRKQLQGRLKAGMRYSSIPGLPEMAGPAAVALPGLWGFVLLTTAEMG